jgi:hypothetical protein
MGWKAGVIANVEKVDRASFRSWTPGGILGNLGTVDLSC